VAITSPSSGEYPIEVSTERPRRMAAAEHPPPRCRLMIVGSPAPVIAAYRSVT
jgi:hypothetical protein